MTDDEIQALIACPKIITHAEPRHGYGGDSRSAKKNLTLRGENDPSKNFHVFIRQSKAHIEIFSVGLRYKTGDKTLGDLTFVRYNGPHGARAKDISVDGHYSMPHIHLLTAELLASGVKEPCVQQRIPVRFSIFDEAVQAFSEDCGITNWREYFPAQLQLVP